MEGNAIENGIGPIICCLRVTHSCGIKQVKCVKYSKGTIMTTKFLTLYVVYTTHNIAPNLKCELNEN